MEEKKLKIVSKEKQPVKKQEDQKLDYTQLKNAAQQIAMQAEQLAQENMQLKKVLNNSDWSNFFNDLSFRFKVLKYAHLFDDDFVDKNISYIQEVLTPKEEEDKEKKDNSEDNEEEK